MKPFRPLPPDPPEVLPTDPELRMFHHLLQFRREKYTEEKAREKAQDLDAYRRKILGPLYFLEKMRDEEKRAMQEQEAGARRNLADRLLTDQRPRYRHQ